MIETNRRPVTEEEEMEVAGYLLENLPPESRGVAFGRWPITMEEAKGAVESLRCQQWEELFV